MFGQMNWNWKTFRRKYKIEVEFLGFRKDRGLRVGTYRFTLLDPITRVTYMYEYDRYMSRWPNEDQWIRGYKAYAIEAANKFAAQDKHMSIGEKRSI